nr:hypothetical protein BaRGS_018821 [Batillaria attramentaria]
MRKVGAHGPARALPKETFQRTYVPPTRKVFSRNSQFLAIKDEQENAESDKHFSYFPEMSSLAQTAVTPDTAIEDMTADQIIGRLQELGWRKEGEAARLAAEKEKREQEKQKAEHEMKKRATLDLINDPLLARVAKKSHALPQYTKPPESRPCAVCFDAKGPSVTHATIKQQIDHLIAEFEDVVIKIESLEYQPRAVHINAGEPTNRWVITLNSQFAVSYLDGSKIMLGKQEVEVRRYDAVIGLEYKQFKTKSTYMEMLHT